MQPTVLLSMYFCSQILLVQQLASVRIVRTPKGYAVDQLNPSNMREKLLLSTSMTAPEPRDWGAHVAIRSAFRHRNTHITLVLCMQAMQWALAYLDRVSSVRWHHSVLAFTGGDARWGGPSVEMHR